MSDDDLRHDDGQRHDGEAVRPADGTGAAVSEDQRRREALDRLKQLRVADLVEEMLIGLVTVGYQKLGLTDQTRELRDLGEARLAIETLRAWIDVLARERGEEGLADLRSTVAAMQLSYARAAAEAASGDAGADAAAEVTAEPGAGVRSEAKSAGTDETAPGDAPDSDPAGS